MNSVWVLMFEIPYEGGSLNGIFKSKESAIDFLTKIGVTCTEEYNGYYTFDVEHGNYYVLYEEEVK